MEMKPATVRQFNLPVTVLEDKGSFIVYTPLLDLSSVGNTEQEARENFVEAVRIFFEECIEEDCLDEALTNLGWKKVKQRWEIPQVITQSQAITVPVPA